MKKVVIVLILLSVAVFGALKYSENKRIQAERKQAQKEKQLKQIDFHKYPVKNDPKQITTKTLADKPVNTQRISKNLSQNSTSVSNAQTTQKNISGKKIPDWVYENTASGDKYYSLIHSQTNFVFTSYADCPIGQSRKMMVSNAISKAGLSSSFLNRVELNPNGSTIHATCVKSYKGNMCYAKKSEMKEGTCKCAIHYLLDNCRSRFCIVNPTQRRIIFVEPNEDSLTKKLVELKYNW